MLASLLDWTWILTGVIGLITMFLVRHVLQVRSLPPGPFPLPVLGNLLSLRGKGNEFFNVVSRLQKKHKDIFTLWLGHKPTVFICSWELCHEAAVQRKNDFSGRVKREILEIFLDYQDDVAFSDFGPRWEILRKILLTAVRKYAVSDNLADLVSDVVDRTAESMFKKGKAVDATEMMYLIIYNILASSAFGQRFEMDDPDFIRLRKNNDEVNEKFGVGLPSDALPLLRPFYKKRIEELTVLTKVAMDYIKNKYREHVSTYQTGDVRDFTDAVISAKEEAEAEGKDYLQYLTDGNLTNVLGNLFGAGTDTTRSWLTWVFLIICDRQEVQMKMQQEIDQHIGSRAPIQTDKSLCHYINAVLTETLRFTPVIDVSLEHKTICDTEIGGYKIPKDTSCFFYIKGPQTDTTHWDEPEKFKPERFLGPDGKFINTKFSGYLPFGLGRRSCPGEKLAIADSFLVTARLLQKFSFELEKGPGSVEYSADPSTFINLPPPYKLIVKERN